MTIDFAPVGKIWRIQEYQNLAKSKNGRSLLVLGFTILGLAQVLQIVSPLVLERVITVVGSFARSEVDAPSITALILVYCTLLLIAKAAFELSDFLLIKFISLVDQKIRQRALQSMLKSQVNLPDGEVFAIWDRGHEAVSSIGNAILLQLIPKLATLIVVVSVIFAKYGYLVLFLSFVGAALYGAWLSYIFRRIRKVVEKQNATQEHATGVAVDYFKNRSIFQMFGHGYKIFSRSEGAFEKQIIADIDLVKWQSIWMAGNAAIASATLAGTLSIAIVSNSASGISAGSLVALIYFVGLLFQPIESITDAIRSVSEDGIRATEMLDQMTEVSAQPKSTSLDDFIQIEIENFTPESNDGSPMFEPISTVVKKGEPLVVFAASGTGKSSLLRGLLGKQKSRGSLRIESVSGEKTEIRDLSRYFSYLPQETLHLDQSALLNLTLGIPHKREHVEITLDTVGFDRKMWTELFSDELPTNSLSGGEKRRLALARLLLNGKKFTILDEPFSGLELSSVALVSNELVKYNSDGMLVILVHECPSALSGHNNLELNPISKD